MLNSCHAPLQRWLHVVQSLYMLSSPTLAPRVGNCLYIYVTPMLQQYLTWPLSARQCVITEWCFSLFSDINSPIILDIPKHSRGDLHPSSNGHRGHWGDLSASISVVGNCSCLVCAWGVACKGIGPKHWLKKRKLFLTKNKEMWIILLPSPFQVVLQSKHIIYIPLNTSKTSHLKTMEHLVIQLRHW